MFLSFHSMLVWLANNSLKKYNRELPSGLVGVGDRRRNGTVNVSQSVMRAAMQAYKINSLMKKY